MTHQALTFTLTSPSGRLLGMALVCVEARYASIYWAGAHRMDRLHVAAADWKAVELQIGLGLNPSSLPQTSALWEILVGGEHGDRSTIVQWMSVEPVTVDRPEMTPEVLDGKLRGVVGRSVNLAETDQ